MKLHIAWIHGRRSKDKSGAVHTLSEDYIKRISHYVPLQMHPLTSEAGLLQQREKLSGTRLLVLLDAQGKQLSSMELAEFLRGHQNRGTQHLLFAVGGPDGFTSAARRAADLQLSLSKMTLPHELARVVLLEQLYRAFTILHRHPYHTGH